MNPHTIAALLMMAGASAPPRSYEDDEAAKVRRQARRDAEARDALRRARHNDPNVAAQLRAERKKRKAANYAKRYPNRKTS